MTNNFEDFEKWLKSMGKRDETTRNYLYYLTKIPFDIIGKPSQVNNFLLVKSNWKPSELGIATSAVRSYYDFLGKREMIALIRKPKYHSGRKKIWLTPEQYTKIEDVCNDDFERIICRILVETGVRRSTLLELKKTDIDFDKGEITIRKNYFGNKGQLNYSVPISPQLLDMLRSWIKNSSDKIIPIQSPQEVTDLIIRIGKRAGIFLSPHVLRHTFGVWFYNESKDILQTRDAMGQRSVKSTEIYAESTSKMSNIYEKIFPVKAMQQ